LPIAADNDNVFLICSMALSHCDLVSVASWPRRKEEFRYPLLGAALQPVVRPPAKHLHFSRPPLYLNPLRLRRIALHRGAR
jgi:hypothetical protein